MPHECTNCGRAFADGSKEMLSGCPECGGNKFQFRPAGASSGSSGSEESAASGPAAEPSRSTPDETEGSSATESGRGAAKRQSSGGRDGGAVGRAASTVREWVGTSDTGRPEPDTSDQQPTDAGASSSKQEPSGDAGSVPVDSDEDSAQANARTDVVSENELPEDDLDGAAAEGAGTVADSPDDEDDQPSLDELREELNSQFESIKVVNPGQYELNLMELYEREEYVIALQENGRYVIQVPDAWTDGAES